MSCAAKSTGPAGAAPCSETVTSAPDAAAIAASSFNFMRRILHCAASGRDHESSKPPRRTKPCLYKEASCSFVFFVIWWSLHPGKFVQRLARDAEDRPPLHRRRAELL